MEKIIYDELEFCEECGCLEKEHYIITLGRIRCSLCESCVNELVETTIKFLNIKK